MITGGNARQSRRYSGYKTFTISPWTDTAVRLGGDEFTVILENIKHGIPDANMLAQKILETLQHPIQLDSVTATISASIGISMHHPYDERSTDQLVNAADSAMYTAKHAGKNQVCVHK